jgi:hypothetical protein
MTAMTMERTTWVTEMVGNCFLRVAHWPRDRKIPTEKSASGIHHRKPVSSGLSSLRANASPKSATPATERREVRNTKAHAKAKTFAPSSSSLGRTTALSYRALTASAETAKMERKRARIPNSAGP